MFKKVNLAKLRKSYVEEIVRLLGECGGSVKSADIEDACSGELNVYIDDGVLHEFVIKEVRLVNIDYLAKTTFEVVGVDFTNWDDMTVQENEIIAFDDIVAVYNYIKTYHA